jgi:hypothetical protein
VEYIIYTSINLKNHDCHALVKIRANHWQECSDNAQKIPKKNMETVGYRLIFLRMTIDMKFHIGIGGIYIGIEWLWV